MSDGGSQFTQFAEFGVLQGELQCRLQLLVVFTVKYAHRIPQAEQNAVSTQQTNHLHPLRGIVGQKTGAERIANQRNAQQFECA